jgi:hypothetical protein
MHSIKNTPAVERLLPASAGFLLGLLFDAENGGDICLRNIVLFSKYMALQPKKPIPTVAQISQNLTVYSSSWCLLIFDSYVKIYGLNIPGMFSEVVTCMS